MSASEACKLTARQKARLDEDVIFFWPPWSKSVAKWIFTVLLALAIFCGAVASRLSFMVVAISIMPDNGGNNTKMSFMEEISSSDELYINDEFKFLTLVVILMVPYGVEFLRCVWLHGFLRGHPWPSKVAVAVGIGISLMEVFGNCYFTIAVLSIPELSSTELILFMNGIFILPSLKNFLDPRKRQSYLNIMALVTVLFDLGGISWGIYKFFSTKARIAIPASLVLLNIAWFNPLRKWQTQPIKQPGQALYHPVLVNDTNQSTSTDRLTEFDDVLSPDPFAGRATIKSGIINSALKLCAVPFVSAFFCHFYETLSLHDISPSHIGPSMGFYWTCLWVNVLCSFVVYNMGYLACSMGLQCQAFAFPLMLVTPVCLFLSSAHWSCNSELFQFFCGMVTGDRYYHVLIIAAMLWIGLVAYVILYIWKPQEEKMAKEKDLFFIPYSYSGVFLEQYLILNREDRFVHRPSLIAYPSSYANVFLCTTVYREDPNVMEQYLHCLSRMYSCQRKYTSIETHIVFDDAFTAKGKLNEHAQNFINLSKDTLKQSDANIAQTVKMPYGSQIVITLEDGMQVYVHFKDSAKVKRGKRWSQMMIMSWIIDTKSGSINDPSNTYFFTCDVDVTFTYTSIERLLDVMVRKPFVGGATCRVHAQGSGPVVWYQMFEYAVWHWVFKAANSVIGSVICCTGCFSVFRLQALSDVLPVFSRPTESAADYIKRDLGEDRWLSCMLIESGWILDYCSMAEVSTVCPESFDGFFQQRRHWITSSFANTSSLIKDFWKVRHLNSRLSVFFFVYLITIVFFMVVSPAVMIWMITGTFSYVVGSRLVLLTVGIPFLTTVLLIYIAACLFTLPDFHRAFAKGFSYVLAIMVFILALTSIVHVITHHKETLTSDDPPYHLDKEMAISVSLLYLIIYLGVFVATALIHARESYCCLQSLWYLMCLPAFHIFLITYTVCNIHKMNSELEAPDDNVGWYLRFLKMMCRRQRRSPHASIKYFCCSCCSSATDSTLSKAIDVNETETFDKCEGVDEVDILTGEEETEDEPKDNEILDLGILEQRQYWKQLQEAFLSPHDELQLSDLRKQLCHIRNGALLVFSISNILWFIVDFGVLLFNPLGFASLTLFTAVVLIQFIAMCYHRLMTVAYELSRATFIPKHSDGGCPPQELSSLLDSQAEGTSDTVA